jgi:hypothetical protein
VKAATGNIGPTSGRIFGQRTMPMAVALSAHIVISRNERRAGLHDEDGISGSLKRRSVVKWVT